MALTESQRTQLWASIRRWERSRGANKEATACEVERVVEEIANGPQDIVDATKRCAGCQFFVLAMPGVQGDCHLGWHPTWPWDSCEHWVERASDKMGPEPHEARPSGDERKGR
jgi:hypothetical protein